MTVDSKVLIAGETLVDLVPDHPGPPGEAGGYVPRFGGAPANVAIGMARLATPPSFWTRLATDDFGEFLREQLIEADVPEDLLTTDADARTTVALVTHDATGDRSFAFYREGGADERMEPGTVSDDVLDDLEWVHLSGVPLCSEPSRSALLELAERASDRCVVSLDPNWRPELWTSRQEYGAVVRGTLDDVDVLLASPEDLAAAGFETDEPATLARTVTDYGPHTVVVTLGADGAVCEATDASPLAGSARHGGYDVDVVDTTGAGDTFVAGLLTALTNGVTDGERALTIANAAGAVATTEKGAVTGLSDLDTVAQLCGNLPWAN